VIWRRTCGDRWPGRGPATTLRGSATTSGLLCQRQSGHARA
jgi:hypothetical protein